MPAAGRFAIAGWHASLIRPEQSRPNPRKEPIHVPCPTQTAEVLRRSLLASTLVAAALIGVTATSAAAASVASPARGDRHHAVTCQSGFRIPVALAPGQPASSTISGELCSTWAERFPGTTVQLLIPGATYTRDYWDFGTVGGIRYSYARDVAARGFATFVIDPLGSGDSSHPVSTQITAQADAYVDHQVVQALRAGWIAGVRFGKVIEVGHSLNSLIVWDEAIAYHDVDGVIVTGAAHSLTAGFASSGDFYPAINDPKFAASGLDSGYLTTIPGTRAKLFYHLPDADPAVIALDETRKDVVSGTELTSALPVLATTATQAIDVPVLDILGGNDFTTCGLSTTGQHLRLLLQRSGRGAGGALLLPAGPAPRVRDPRLRPRRLPGPQPRPPGRRHGRMVRSLRRATLACSARQLQWRRAPARQLRLRPDHSHHSTERNHRKSMAPKPEPGSGPFRWGLSS